MVFTVVSTNKKFGSKNQKPIEEKSVTRNLLQMEELWIANLTRSSGMAVSKNLTGQMVFVKTRSGFVAQQCTFSFCLIINRFIPQKEVTEIKAHPHTIHQICLCLTHCLFPRVRMMLKFFMRYKTSTRMRLIISRR